MIYCFRYIFVCEEAYMDYHKLLDFVTDLGYELSMSGAEIYRVEESVSRVLAAYGLEAEVYAIPNCLHISVTMPDGKTMMEMRRIGFHGNDLDSVEVLSGLSRRVCAEKPDADTAKQWLEEVCANRKNYKPLLVLIGYFFASFAFGVFFGGDLLDGICAGLAGIVVGLCSMFMDRLQTNNFFKTILVSIPLAFIPYLFGFLGVIDRPDMATIGTVMVLIPGLLFVHAMRDIIFGDTNSGVNRIVQVLLTAVAIACGTAVAWFLATALWGEPVSVAAIDHPFYVECLAGMIGCVGFAILFNVHGKGIFFCPLAGIICWCSYGLTEALGGNEMMASFIAAFATAIFSEVMARVRKCPAIGYLIVGLIPLIPGSSLYYTMNYCVRGNMEMFATQGMKTIAIAGLMAAGILLVSTSMRMWVVWKQQRKR